MKFGVHVVLTLAVGLALGSLVWKHAPGRIGPMSIAGLALMAIGFVLWTMARFQLGHSFTVSAQANQLVTQGLYSKIRNPIYIFGSCLIAGVILFFQRPIWLLIFLVVVPMQILRAIKEAEVLEAKFGNEYRLYRAGTWFLGGPDFASSQARIHQGALETKLFIHELT